MFENTKYVTKFKTKTEAVKLAGLIITEKRKFYT